MADEAVNPARGGARAPRWGEECYAGAWVRWVDIGYGVRARWIDDDGRAVGEEPAAADAPGAETRTPGGDAADA